tara:strand:- start:7132 stop:8799 length:1668 start_codon:yes stop_codon:yes gene_type:complete
MANALQNVVSQFGNVSQQPATRQLGLLFGLAASIALGIGLVQWASKPDFMPLYGEMSPGAITEVLQSLDTAGIEYRYDGRSGTVSVPSDRVHQARLNLASEGLPQGDKSGFNMLYEEQQMGISSFIEKARYDRALEHELARSIASLDSVKAARVHLAVPKQSAFVRKTSKPAASVLLSLYPGRDLTERQLAGVAFLVASSVPGLTAESVSVVDNQGKLLSAQGEKDGMGYTKEQFRYTQQLEESYIDRINEILTPILGVGAFRAQVTADVDFTMIERTSESYAPEQKVRSEQLVEELTENVTVEGIPGTLSNQPPRETQVGAEVPPGAAVAGTGEPSAPTRSSKKEVRNYELDKTISHIREVPGNLNKLSVAVVVDYRTTVGDSGEPEKLPLSDEQMAQINSLVREAVGFSEARGDSVNVVSAGFVAAPALEAIPGPSLMEQDWVWKVAKMVLGVIGFLLLLFTVLRPLMQAGSSSAGMPQQLGGPAAQPGMLPGGESVNGMQLGEDQVTLGQQQLGLPGGAPAYQQQLTMARNMVDQEPERVAHVVKNWVAADG